MSTKSIATAYHEAGHAVAASIRPRARRVSSVSIEPDEFTAGRIHRCEEAVSEPSSEPIRLDLPQLVDEIVVLLAGPQAELRFTGFFDSLGANNDYERAISLATKYGHVLDIDAFMDWLRSESEEFVDAFWPEIERLAEELHDLRTLTEQDVKRLLQGSKKRE